MNSKNQTGFLNKLLVLRELTETDMNLYNNGDMKDIS